MKNELAWSTGENGELPMVLDEKGLGLKGFAKFSFYFCASISLLSMIWVIVVSVGAFVSSKQDPTLPSYYPTFTIALIAISMMCINSLLKFYRDKTKYEKHVEIDKVTIKYHEVDSHKTTDWSEKIRKYDAVELRHYNYRGIKSWYIFLSHKDKDRRVPIFAPEYNFRSATEETKRETLSFYSKLFNLPEVYLDLEASYKKAEEEAGKNKSNE